MNKLSISSSFSSLLSSLEAAKVSLSTTETQLSSLLEESLLLEESKVALEQAKPLISASSITQLESLANTAIESIFGFPGTISWDPESKRFQFSTTTLSTDLVDSNGGGLLTVISFVFDIFLLVKQGARRILVYDEAFTAISDEYFPAFLDFLRQAIHDLDIDLLLVSHDVRIDPSVADTCYRISDHKSIRVK